MSKVQGVPNGFRTLTPHLVIKGASEAAEFYKNVFHAEEIGRMLTPERRIMHLELKIGDSMLFICEEIPPMNCKGPTSLGGTPVTIHVFVEDVDAVFNRAVKAGATVTMPVNNMFWGDRYGKFVDPFGHNWGVATRVEDLTPEEIKARQDAFFAWMVETAHA
ncbi:MAG: glyoxalase [Candidatus Melainabacteria bacterium]|nr:MAG: glyoxalase [Candidatus Melainabacteria bacterium]